MQTLIGQKNVDRIRILDDLENEYRKTKVGCGLIEMVRDGQKV